MSEQTWEERTKRNRRTSRMIWRSRSVSRMAATAEAGLKRGRREDSIRLLYRRRVRQRRRQLLCLVAKLSGFRSVTCRLCVMKRQEDWFKPYSRADRVAVPRPPAPAAGNLPQGVEIRPVSRHGLRPLPLVRHSLDQPSINCEASCSQMTRPDALLTKKHYHGIVIPLARRK